MSITHRLPRDYNKRTFETLAQLREQNEALRRPSVEEPAPSWLEAAREVARIARQQYADALATKGRLGSQDEAKAMHEAEEYAYDMYELWKAGGQPAELEENEKAW